MSTPMSPDFLLDEVARWERDTGARADTAVFTGPSGGLSLQQWARGVALWELLEEARDGEQAARSRPRA